MDLMKAGADVADVADVADSERKLRLYQCPGCWGHALHRVPMPIFHAEVECECGERMTLVDLRARTRHGPHAHEGIEALYEDER